MTSGTRDGDGRSASGKKGQGKGGKRGARDRLAAEREQQAKADKRKRQRSNIAIAVVVAAVAGFIVVYAVIASNDSGPQNAALPALVQEQGGGVVFGEGPVDVALWEDFQCPGCKGFEQANGAMLEKRVDAGDITMVIHPLSFLDQNLGNSSSVAAANAFGCAEIDGNPENIQGMVQPVIMELLGEFRTEFGKDKLFNGAIIHAMGRDRERRVEG